MGYDWYKQKEYRLPDGDEDQVAQSTSSADQQAQAENQQQAEQAQADARQAGEEAKAQGTKQPGELPDMQYKPLTKRQQRRKQRLEEKKEQNGTLNPRQGGKLKDLQLQDKYNKSREAEAIRENNADDDTGSRELSEKLDEELEEELEEKKAREISDEFDRKVTREISEKLRNGSFKPQEQSDTEEETADEDDERPEPEADNASGNEDGAAQLSDEKGTEPPTSTPEADNIAPEAEGGSQTEPRDTIAYASEAITDPTIRSASGARSHTQGHSYYDADKFGIGDIAKTFNENPILNTYLRNTAPPESPEYDKKKEKRLKAAQFFNILGGLFNMVDDVATAKNRGVVFKKDYTTRQGILEKFIDQNKALHAKAQENYTEQMKVYRKGLWDAMLNDEKHRMRAFEQLVKASSEKYNDGYSESVSLNKFNYDGTNGNQRRLASSNSAWIRHVNVNDQSYVILKADYESLMNMAKANLMSNKQSFDTLKKWFFEKYPTKENIPEQYEALSDILSLQYDANAKTRFQEWTEDNKSTFAGLVLNAIEAGIDPETSRQAELYIFGDNKGRFSHKAGEKPAMMQAILDYYRSLCPEGSTQPEGCKYDLTGIQSKLAGMNLYQIAEAYYDVVNAAPEYGYVSPSRYKEFYGVQPGNGTNVAAPIHSLSARDLGYSNGGDDAMAYFSFDFDSLTSTEKEELKSAVAKAYTDGKFGFYFHGQEVYVRPNRSRTTAPAEAQPDTTETQPDTTETQPVDTTETQPRPEYNDSITIQPDTTETQPVDTTETQPRPEYNDSITIPLPYRNNL